MNMDELSGDTVVQCPYNKSHTIARSRLQRHLIKCEKQHPESFREICPFNATHRFSKLEMQEHIEKCPMRRFMQPELYQKYRYHGSIKPWQPSEIDSNVDLNEYWDDDCESDYKSEVNSRIISSTQFAKEDESESWDSDADDGIAEIREFGALSPRRNTKTERK